MNEGIIGLSAVLVFAVVGTILLAHLGTSRQTKSLLIAGLWIRVLGSIGYLELIVFQYGGGDFGLYFDEGLAYAKHLSSHGWAHALTPWLGDHLWGSSAMIQISGLILFLLGPTETGAFIVCALVGYIGIVCFWLAFRRSFPKLSSAKYLAWLVFFPSLWFWPSALGKDAIVLCGVGLTTLGFVGKAGGKGWLKMALGVALVFIIRPQVAAVVVFAVVSAQWLSTWLRFGVLQIIQAVLLLVAGIGIITLASGALGVELFEPDQIDAYLGYTSDVSSIGGSVIEGEEGSPSPWLAPINTLFRPFVWEENGVTSLASAIEILALWGLLFWKRRDVFRFIRYARATPLFWMAIVFTTVYSVALGMAVGNLGIIARQRIHIFPFILMLLAGLQRSPVPRVNVRRRQLPWVDAALQESGVR